MMDWDEMLDEMQASADEEQAARDAHQIAHGSGSGTHDAGMGETVEVPGRPVRHWWRRRATVPLG